MNRFGWDYPPGVTGRDIDKHFGDNRDEDTDFEECPDCGHEWDSYNFNSCPYCAEAEAKYGPLDRA